jgi:hypothetical protein
MVQRRILGNGINHNGSGCVDFNLLFTGNCPNQFQNIRHPACAELSFQEKSNS